MMRIPDMILRIEENKQVNMGETSLLKLNGMNMSYRYTKGTTINELEECFFLLLKDL